MFSSKLRVDKHVANTLGRIKDEKEKHAKGYQIAKMYFGVKEYEMARRYLSMFLTVKESFPMAHKLMGEILEAQNDVEGALAAYRRSHQLDDKQKDVVLKICELYCRMEIDPERARYWAEKAEKIDPKHSVVYRLRERIYASSDVQPCSKDLEGLIAEELVKRPHDASLRMRLLRLYIDQERTNEAYYHIIETERHRPYRDNLEWYQTVVEVLEVYKDETGVKTNGSFHYQLLQALCTIAALSLNKSLANATDSLNKFDAGLQSADEQASDSPEWPDFLAEMKAEYFHYAGTLLLKRCMKEKQDWNKSSRLAAACFLASYAQERPDRQAPWYAAASQDAQQSFNNWCESAAYRLSQTGHVLNNMARDHGSAWLTNVKNELCTTQGCQTLHDLLYAGCGIKNRRQTFLLQQPVNFTSFSIRLPTMDQLRVYDDASHRLHPGHLNHLVWIAMQYHEPKQLQPDYHFHVFETLQSSTKSVETSAPESLCRLDVDAFLYATVHNSLVLREQKQKSQRRGSVQYDHLPFSLSENLCSDAQAKWWSATYKLYTNQAKENLTSLRQTLFRGLEVIRVMSNHGLDAKLIIQLAKIFQQRENEVLSRSSDPLDFASEAEHYRSRAKLYWSKALDMLNKTGRKLNIRQPKDLLFPPLGEELTPIQIKDYKREGNFYLACDLMKSGEHEKAIEAFDQLVLPYASYYQAKIYVQLSEDGFGNRSLSEMASDHKDQYMALLDKAKDAFYTTLDRLRNEKHHVLHQVLSNDISEVEDQISLIKGEHLDDPWPPQKDGTPVGVDLSRFGDVTTPSAMSPHACSTPYRPVNRSTLNASVVNGTANQSANNVTLNGVASPEKPRRVHPSPERLQAQIRCLEQNQERIASSVTNSMREMLSANRTMQLEMMEFKTTMEQIKVKLEELTVRQMTPMPPTQYPPAPYPTYAPPNLPPQAMYADYIRYSQFVQSHYPNTALTSLHNLAQVSAQPPSEPKPTPNAFEHEFEDEEFFPDDEYLYSNYGKDKYNVADTDLNQEWPHGNIAEMKGSSTVTYHPQTNLPMPGPGFFRRDGPDSRANSQKPGLLGHSPNVSESFNATPQGKVGLGAKAEQSRTTPAQSTASSLASFNTGREETNKSIQDKSRDSVDCPDDSYDPHFAPVIALPEKVETLTGEEGETVLYEMAKAKLYRYDDGQWKERGRGPVKLLQSKENRVRFVMRREQVLKICANHYLDQKMSLTVGGKVGKNAVVWFAADFAEGEVRNEMFCLRFQTEEQTKEFEKAFNGALKVLENASKTSKRTPETRPIPAVKVADKKPEQPRPSITSGFIVPPAETEASKVDTGPRPFAGFSFGLPGANASSASLFATPDSSKPTTVVPSDFPKKLFGTGSLPAFGQTDQSTRPLFSATAAGATPKFGQSTPFGQVSFPTPVTGSKPLLGVSKPIFGQTSSMDSFSSIASKGDISQTSPGKASSPFAVGPMFAGMNTPKSPGGGDDPHAYEAQPDFKPLIELPELVQFSSGEEEEAKLFGERGKLYRHDPESRSWKERGVGEMKIMRDNRTGRCRIIMRREQVHKVCANHAISEAMCLVKMGNSAKSWCWTAHDFSDPDKPTTEQFAIKFKNEDLAANFKEVFEECQATRSVENSPEKPVQAREPVSSEAIANKFKLKSDEWNCDQCFTRNKLADQKCVCCQGLNPALKKTSFTLAGVPASVVTPQTDAKSAAIFDRFKKKDDEWECSSCLIRNKNTFHACQGCQVRNPNAPAEVKATPTAAQFGTSSPGGGFKFGGPLASGGSGFGGLSGFGSGFGGGSTSTPSGSGGVFSAPSTGFKAESGGAKVEGGFTFVGGVNTPTENETSTPGFSFGQTSAIKPTSGFTFGQSAKLGQPTQSTPFSAKPAESGAFGLGPSVTPTSDGFSFGAQNDTKTQTPEKSQFSFTSSQGALNTGFNFSTPTTNSLNEKFSTSTPMASPQVDKPPTTPVVLSAALTGGFKFGDQSTKFSFSGVTPSKLDTSNPAALAKSPLSPKTPEDHYHQEEDDSHIYFEPIVPLPAKVDIQTGEEDETEKFSHRAKLYRFVNKEWKERGLGNIKVLEHNQTNKLRLVMRREQVKKLCLNHWIMPDMELTPMKGGKGAAWVWLAVDFAEGEATQDKFCIKFKTPEIANDFKAAFEATSADSSSKSAGQFSFKLDDADISDTKVPGNFTFQSPNSSGTQSPGFTFGDRFRMSPAVGNNLSTFDWKKGADDDDDGDCVVTEVVMPSAADRALARKYRLPETFYNYKTMPDCPGCLGCTDTMPVYRYADDDDVEITGTLSASPASVERARSLRLPDNFYLYEKKSPCKGCRGCNECEETGDTAVPSVSGFGQPKFGAPSHPAFGAVSNGAGALPGTTAAGVFGIGESRTGLESFADLANVPVKGFAGKGSDKPFSWSGAGASIFGETGDESVTDDDPHYEPIIPLPEVVEISTGEENENCIWSHRCKLFRFDGVAKAWKERAIGEIKVLKHNESARYRLVMRREQVKKTALNHVLGLDLDLQPMKTSETSWCWYAQDFAEPTQSGFEQFAVKFKTKEIAERFRDVFLDCQKTLRLSEEGEVTSTSGVDTPAVTLVQVPQSQQAQVPPSQPVAAVAQAPQPRQTQAPQPEPAQVPQSEAAKDDRPEAKDEAVDVAGKFPDEDDYEEDYEDVQDDEPLFEKRVNLTKRVNNQLQPPVMGTLTLYEADYGYGYKISMDTDEGKPIADHYIVMETKLGVDKKKKTAEWNALDFSENRTGTQTIFTAIFSSASALLEYEELLNSCIESAKGMALSEHDLVTDIHEIDEPEVVGRIHEDEDDYTGTSRKPPLDSRG